MIVIVIDWGVEPFSPSRGSRDRFHESPLTFNFGEQDKPNKHHHKSLPYSKVFYKKLNIENLMSPAKLSFRKEAKMCLFYILVFVKQERIEHF